MKIKPPFNDIWRRIIQRTQEGFYSKTGLPFTYEVSGNMLVTSRTDYNLSKSNFRNAYDLLPIEKPGDITHIIRGSSYVWAILYDPRIS